MEWRPDVTRITLQDLVAQTSIISGVCLHTGTCKSESVHRWTQGYTMSHFKSSDIDCVGYHIGGVPPNRHTGTCKGESLNP